MKGYKGFEPDMTCRGKQYEVGKTYTMDAPPILCMQGYHFCDTLKKCTDYYPFDNSVFCEVEADGIIVGNEEKRATNRLTVLRRLTPIDVNRAKYGDGYGDGNGYGYGFGNGYGYGYYGNSYGNGRGDGYGGYYDDKGDGYGGGYYDGYYDGKDDSYGYCSVSGIQRIFIFKEA